ncbi:MAG: nucleotidyl transferase AbiEii/AbiGii toxin family protein [bacterium]
MTQFEKTILRLDDNLMQNNLRYILIGGYAVILYGIQRVTKDIDITLLIEFDVLKATAARILKFYKPRKDHPEDFFEKYFVLPVTDPETGVEIDISAGLGGFDRSAVRRAIQKKVAGRSIPCCTVEDLIIYKLAADRGRDRDDVQLLARLYSKHLDSKYLLAIARAFIDLERSDVLENVQQLLKMK